MRKSYILYILHMCLVLVACAGNPQPEPRPEIEAYEVGQSLLNTASTPPPEFALLDIGVQIFSNAYVPYADPGNNEWVFDEIRDNETQYLPYALRNTLTASNHWGAGRVLPGPDPSMHLMITGELLHSDGSELVLAIHAQDSTGRVWLNETYRDRAEQADFPESTRYTPGNRFDPGTYTEPFQDIYNQINNDLVAARDTLGFNELERIGNVAMLVYANELSPDSFGHMLVENADGLLDAAFLPSVDDPMLKRAMDMQLRHHLFIDTVDEYYEALFEDMRVAYLVWRRYSHDQLTEESSLIDRTTGGRQVAGNGFLALSQRYDRFKWSKIYEQEFTLLATGFNNEVAPAILETNRQVHGLSGTMEEQYGQWRLILKSLFELESALPDL